MLNIVIPMSGLGSRFEKTGRYSFPKPLIEMHNHKPMIQVVVDNINMEGRYIFIVRQEHYDKYSLKYLLPLIVAPNPCIIIPIDKVTEGAACTVFLAKEYIDNDDELVIANSDQWVSWNSSDFLNYMRKKNADGGILTFFSTHPKWSFVRVDELSNKILEVAEKKVISNIATVGIYWYKRGKDFIWATDQMIKKNIRVNNEFYVAPCFNEMIANNDTILPYPVAEMCSLGTPEDLEYYLRENKPM